MYTVPAKILYLQRYSTDFRNLWHRSKILGRPSGWKVSGAQVFYFCNGNVKTLPIDNTFKLYTVPAKTLSLQRYSPIFKIFAAPRRCWGWEFGCKVSSAQVFYFSNGKVRNLPIDNIWNFASFNLYTVPAKILYLQRYSTDFRNLWQRSKVFREGIWVESIRCAGILLLQWQSENFAHRQHFQPVHCASKNPISQNVFTRFSKSLPQLEDVEGGHLGCKFLVRSYFTFALARWKLCAWTTFEILQLSTCTLCEQKSYIPKGIQPSFEIFASARRCSGWAFGLKVSGAQVAYFCYGNLKTLRMNNIWNFATFNLYTVPEKIIYLQRYSTDFRNLCLTSKMLRVGIWGESLRCAGILLLQCQGENFAHGQHLKFCHVQPVHRASKNPMSPKVFTRFS